METSKEIIEQAKQRFKDLKHKNYEWVSFYNGFLEAKALNMRSVVKSVKENTKPTLTNRNNEERIKAFWKR